MHLALRDFGHASGVFTFQCKTSRSVRFGDLCQAQTKRDGHLAGQHFCVHKTSQMDPSNLLQRFCYVAKRGHFGFLASDELKECEAKSPEYGIAARYVAAQLEATGLNPAGAINSFLQPVPLVAFRAACVGTIAIFFGSLNNGYYSVGNKQVKGNHRVALQLI